MNKLSMSESPTNDTKKETIVIRGIVKDKEGTPLPGVTILIKGSTVGVSTDVKGEYVMNVEKRDSLVLSFSFVGMKTKEVKWTGQQTLNVVLEEDVSEVEEVVVIGYGTTTKKDLTGSVASFDSQIIEESTATSVAHMMQGQIPGLSILAGDGAPGSPARLEIRGVPSTKRGNLSFNRGG